jgi:hypothetical protein
MPIRLRSLQRHQAVMLALERAFRDLDFELTRQDARCLERLCDGVQQSASLHLERGHVDGDPDRRGGEGLPLFGCLSA